MLPHLPPHLAQAPAGKDAPPREPLRADDRPEAIGKRLEAFHAQTAEPLKGYYGTRDVLCEIDADRSPEVIYEELAQLMQ